MCCLVDLGVMYAFCNGCAYFELLMLWNLCAFAKGGTLKLLGLMYWCFICDCSPLTLSE